MDFKITFSGVFSRVCSSDKIYFYFYFVRQCIFLRLFKVWSILCIACSKLCVASLTVCRCGLSVSARAFHRNPLYRDRVVKKSTEILKMYELMNQFHQCVILCSHENSTMAQENDAVENKALNDSWIKTISDLLF